MSTTVSESNSITINNQELLIVYTISTFSAILATCSCLITGMIAMCNLKRMKEGAAPPHRDPIYETACHTEVNIAMVHNSAYQTATDMTNNESSSR